MSLDLDARLKAAVAERDRLSAESQKIAGRKESAEKALGVVEAEIRSKNLDPETLESTLKKLESAYEEAVSLLEQGIKASKEALAPYQEKR